MMLIIFSFRNILAILLLIHDDYTEIVEASYLMKSLRPSHQRSLPVVSLFHIFDYIDQTFREDIGNDLDCDVSINYL